MVLMGEGCIWQALARQRPEWEVRLFSSQNSSVGLFYPEGFLFREQGTDCTSTWRLALLPSWRRVMETIAVATLFFFFLSRDRTFTKLMNQRKLPFS